MKKTAGYFLLRKLVDISDRQMIDELLMDSSLENSLFFNIIEIFPGKQADISLLKEFVAFLRSIISICSENESNQGLGGEFDPSLSVYVQILIENTRFRYSVEEILNNPEQVDESYEVIASQLRSLLSKIDFFADN